VSITRAVDNAAPIISDVALSPEGRIEPGDSVTIQATVTDLESGVDDDTVRAIVKSPDGGELTVVELSRTEGNRYIGTWSTTSVPADTYAVSLVADDLAGNSATSVGIAQITVNSRPNIGNLTPATDVDSYHGDTYTLTWTTSDPDSDAIASLYLDEDGDPSAGLIPIPGGVGLDETVGSLTLNVEQFNPGTYHVYASASDEYGTTEVVSAGKLRILSDRHAEIRVAEHSGTPNDDSIVWGAVEIGNSGSEQVVRVHNDGNEALLIANIAIKGPAADDYSFRLGGQPVASGIEVAPGDYAEIYVTAFPSSPGASQATLTFSTNDQDDRESTCLIHLWSWGQDSTSPTWTGNFVINSNDAQRSHIELIDLAFSEDILTSLNALRLFRNGAEEISLADASIVDNGEDDRLLLDVSGLALEDGDYSLRVAANGVVDEAGNTLDVNGDGVGDAGIDNYAVAPFHKLTADANGDRQVTARDMLLVRKSFNTSQGDARFDHNADLNGDGRVNAADLRLVKNGLGNTVAELAPPRLVVAESSGTANDNVVSFETVAVDAEAATIELAISNDGEKTLTISALQIAGKDAEAFSFALEGDVPDNTGFMLSGGESKTINLAFNPAGPGQYAAELLFSHNDDTLATPSRVSITGKCEASSEDPPSAGNDGQSLATESLLKMTDAHHDGGAVALNGKLYAWTGYTNYATTHRDRTAAMEIFDPATEVWSRGADIPGARSGAGCFALDGMIYTVGGEKSPSGSFSRAVYRYDPAADGWETLNDFPTRIWAPLAVECDGEAYLVGGRHGYGATYSHVYRYDAGNDSWTQVAPMPISVIGAGAASFGGKVYVFGGVHKTSESHYEYTNAIQLYDPSSDSWTLAGDMPWQLAATRATVADDGMYLFADWIRDETTNTSHENESVFKFSPENGQWTKYEMTAPVDRYSTGPVVTLDGYVYFTGVDSSTGTRLTDAFRMAIPATRESSSGSDTGASQPDDPRGEQPSDEAPFSPRADDARLLALEVADELLPPEELCQRIARDLELIDRAYPEMAVIQPRLDWSPKSLFVTLTPQARARFDAGEYHAWDELNSQLGVESVDTFSISDSLVLHFGQVYNAERLVEEYGRIAGVDHAAPNMMIGDGNDIEVQGQYYLFSKGWGDNPAGSIHHHYWLFSVAGNDARLVYDSDTLPGQVVMDRGLPRILPVVTALNDPVATHDAALTSFAKQGTPDWIRGLESLCVEDLIPNDNVDDDNENREAAADEALMLLWQ